ncbi:MAG TPA: hypothetical protein VFA48_14740 [Gammaproteobacteria bacterium]|nr:hypothetical protein [Gammaproteobacteria bacterium]
MQSAAALWTGGKDSLMALHEDMGIDCVVTGDIAEVDGYPNWIRERCRCVGVGVHTRLWGRDRYALLRQLADRGYKALISCVDTHRLDATWIGRELNELTIAELRVMGELTGLDPCGEQGEYHTLGVDGPAFVRPIDIRSYTRRSAGPLAYMAIESFELESPCA